MPELIFSSAKISVSRNALIVSSENRPYARYIISSDVSKAGINVSVPLRAIVSIPETVRPLPIHVFDGTKVPLSLVLVNIVRRVTSITWAESAHPFARPATDLSNLLYGAGY